MKKNNYLPVVWFVLGFGIFIFSRMSKLVPTMPVAILIAPIFILRFIRTQPARRGILLTLLGFLVTINIGLWGIFDMGGEISSLIFNLIRSTLLALLYFLPFMADRLIYPKFKDNGPLSTLVFPVFTTAVFFLLTIEGPFEGSYQMGKFIYGPTILKQYISLFGLPAAVFMTSWFASVINYAWENNFNWAKSKTLALTYGALVLVVVAFGAVRMSPLVVPESETVKIASVVLNGEDGQQEKIDDMVEGRYTHPYDERMSEIEKRTQIAAENGAEIVAVHELAMLIDEKDRERFIARSQEIAKENNVYFVMNYGYYVKDGKGANQMLVIDDHGNTLLTYDKKYLLGIGDIGETAAFKKGPEVMQSVDTPYGRLGVSVCREIDMAKYLVQAGRQNVDIMISPAHEWPVNLVINFGYMRGIENGFSVVRPTYNGISFASDFNGNVLATMDFDLAKGGIMYADVPTKGVNTLYPHIGDVFGWLCVVGALGLILLTIVLSVRRKRQMVTDDYGAELPAT
jgi:apolipoprotein N-acyltransferase